MGLQNTAFETKIFHLGNESITVEIFQCKGLYSAYAYSSNRNFFVKSDSVDKEIAIYEALKKYRFSLTNKKS